MNLTIKQQGAPLTNEAFVLYQSEKCIVLEIDMLSKYCSIEATAGHDIFIGAGEHSLRLSENHKREDWTIVTVDLPPGTWTYTCGSGGRYTLTVCYLKRD